MTLTFLEIGQRWPDAVVLWDRDVAPTLDWEPRFVVWHAGPERVELVEAVHQDCAATGHWSSLYGNCRCLRWDGTQWLTRYITANEPQEWRREYLGQWLNDRMVDGRVFLTGDQYHDFLEQYLRGNLPGDDRAEAYEHYIDRIRRRCHRCGSSIIAGACSNLGCFAEQPR